MSLTNAEPSEKPAPTSSLNPYVKRFNHDLLIKDQDRDYAKSQFPQIAHLLDYPRLKEKFAEYETNANHARAWVRRLGFAAVMSATVALLALATKPLWPNALTGWPAMLIEVAGLLSAIIAVGGLWLGSWKHHWLQSRLMTERLRQWHFQLLVRRGKEIEASCANADARETFKKERERWFDSFLQEHEGGLDAQLESLANQPDQADAWLHHPSTPYSLNKTTLAHVFDAYKQLRFDHQYGYAIYKLRTSTDTPFWNFINWPEIPQRTVLSGIAAFCFIGALICSVILVYGHAFHLPTNVETSVGVGALSVALIGAALRAIHEGLALDREIERYNDYRGRTFQLRERFNNTTDAQTRLHLMEEMEIASVDEMKGFLRSHHNARWVL